MTVQILTHPDTGEFLDATCEADYKATRAKKQGRLTWLKLKKNAIWRREHFGVKFVQIDSLLPKVEAPSAITATREEWLWRAARKMEPWFDGSGGKPPANGYRLSCGFPKGGKGGRGATIGMCFSEEVSKDKTREIFVSPVLDQPSDVLQTLLHEMAHAFLDHGAGHKGPFIVVCKHLGFTKPWTQTPCTDALLAKIKTLAEELGPYPHAAMDPKRVKKQGTRLILSVCGPNPVTNIGGCGAKWRSSQAVIDNNEAEAAQSEGVLVQQTGPMCPCGGMIHPDNAEGA